jgi:uncharacterized protein involved in outer membrane biogenesis
MILLYPRLSSARSRFAILYRDGKFALKLNDDGLEPGGVEIMRIWRLALVPVAIIVIAVMAALLIPLDSLRGALESAASAALERQVQIRGHLRLAIFPEFGISLKDVSIANVAGAHDSPMIAVGKVVVGADLSSLLSGRLQVTKVVLKEPVIHLETAGNGVANWQLAKKSADAAESASTSVSLSIARVRIENGTISYFDARSGKSVTLNAVSVALTEPVENGAAQGIAVEGAVTYRDVPVQFSAKFDDSSGFLQGKPSNAVIKASSDKFTTAFTGDLRSSGEATGDITFSSPSLRQLAAWAGEPMPPGNGFGALKVAAAVSATTAAIKLTNAKITLDNMTVGGNVSIDTLHEAMKAELSSVSAFGGTGKATVALDAGGSAPSVHETLDMGGVQTGPLLDQLVGVAKLRATGTVHLDVTGRGLTESEILRSLSGSGSIRLANGSISGADLGAVAKLLQSAARVLGGALGDSSHTDFSSLSASFAIRNGMAQTGDLQMSSPTLNMTGAGTIDLASRQVNFHVVPKAQLGVAGVNLIDVGIPFYVRGTIDNPSFDPDPAGVAKGLVGSVGETATGVVGAVGSTATKVLDVPGNAIKSLFGGN